MQKPHPKRHAVAIGDIRVAGHCKPQAQLWSQHPTTLYAPRGGATVGNNGHLRRLWPISLYYPMLALARFGWGF